MSATGASENVEIRYGSSAIKCQRATENGPASVILKDGQTVTADLLIGADGVKSVVRQSFLAPHQYLSKDYEQMGVVATLQLVEEMSDTHPWQKFLPTGPSALLPLSDKRSSLVTSNSQSLGPEEVQ